MQAIDADAADIAELCSLSKARTGAFLYQMSNELIQIHGGPEAQATMGFLGRWNYFVQKLGITVAMMTGSQTAKAKRSALEATANGDVQLVIGTHALFQQALKPENRGFIPTIAGRAVDHPGAVAPQPLENLREDRAQFTNKDPGELALRSRRIQQGPDQVENRDRKSVV